MRANSIIDKILELLLKALILFTPLFFLLSFLVRFEITGQLFIWLIMLVSGLLIFWKIINNNGGDNRPRFLNIPILIFIFIFFLSCLASSNFYLSIFGSFSRVIDGFTCIAGPALLYFLFYYGWPYGKEKNLYKYGPLSLLINFAVVFILILFINFTEIMPDGIKSVLLDTDFITGWLILNTVLAIISINILDFKHIARPSNIACFVIFFSTLASLFILNQSAVWICLAIGSFLSLILNIIFIKKNALVNIIFLSFVLIISILIPIFISYKPIINHTELKLQKETFLSFIDSSSLIVDSLKSKSWLGSGPASFSRVYAQYKNQGAISPELTLIKFERPPSFFLDILSMSGWFGFIAYSLIFIIFLFGSIKFTVLFRNSSEECEQKQNYDVEKTKIIAAMAAAAMLFAAQIYFSLNYNILFFYWIFISIVAIFLRERLVKINRKREENKITKSVIKKILYIMFGLILAPFFLWVLSEQINFALADYYYKKNPDNEAYLIKSASLAFRRHNYKLLLSGFYLHKANGLMNDPNITDEKKEDLKILISQAITAGESAARLAPNDIDVYAHLGRLYRNISDIVIGSQEVSINNFKKALELEPDNPIYLNELGKLYFNKKLFPEARDYFISALKIMPELDEARLELAKTFTEDNQPEEALKILNDLEIKNADIEILFEQGKIYFNQKKYEEARDKFLFILAKYPNHANALYSLGLTLEALGRPYEALPYYKKTLELNPHNQTIIDKMKNIEATISG